MYILSIILSLIFYIDNLHAGVDNAPIVQIYSEVEEKSYVDKILSDVKSFFQRFAKKEAHKKNVDQMPHKNNGTENEIFVAKSKEAVNVTNEDRSYKHKKQLYNSEKNSGSKVEGKKSKKDFIKSLANSILEKLDKESEETKKKTISYFESKEIKKIRKHIPKEYNEGQARKFTLYSRVTLKKAILTLKINISSLNSELQSVNLEKIDENLHKKLVKISKLNSDVLSSLPSHHFFAPLDLEDVFNRRTKLNNIQTSYYNQLNEIYDEFKFKHQVATGENRIALDIIKKALEQIEQCNAILNAATSMID